MVGRTHHPQWPATQKCRQLGLVIIHQQLLHYTTTVLHTALFDNYMYMYLSPAQVMWSMPLLSVSITLASRGGQTQVPLTPVSTRHTAPPPQPLLSTLHSWRPEGTKPLN